METQDMTKVILDVAPRATLTRRAIAAFKGTRHCDVHALLKAGVLNKADAKIVFTYDVVRVEFELKAA